MKNREKITNEILELEESLRKMYSQRKPVMMTDEVSEAIEKRIEYLKAKLNRKI